MTNKHFIPSREAIYALDAAIRLGNYSQAAAELEVTQGAISRHIHILEQQLGTSLFIKDGRNLKATDTAKRYRRELMIGVSRLKEATEELRAKRNFSHIRLSVLPAVSSCWLVPALGSFLENHNDTIISLGLETKPFNFSYYDYDAAIHAGYDNWSDSISHLLFEEEVLVVCSPKLAQTYNFKDLTDLLRAPLLVTPVTGLKRLDIVCGERLNTPSNKIHEFESFSSVIRAACQNLGIAILPAFLVDHELNDGSLVIAYGKLFATGRAYYLVYPNDGDHHHLNEAFRTWVLGEAKQLRDRIRQKYT